MPAAAGHVVSCGVLEGSRRGPDSLEVLAVHPPGCGPLRLRYLGPRFISTAPGVGPFTGYPDPQLLLLPIAFENTDTVAYRAPVWLPIPDSALTGVHRGRAVRSLNHARLEVAYRRLQNQWNRLELDPGQGTARRLYSPRRLSALDRIGPGEITIADTLAIELRARADGFRLHLVPQTVPVGLPVPESAPQGWSGDSIEPVQVAGSIPLIPKTLVVRFHSDMDAASRQLLVEYLRAEVVGGPKNGPSGAEYYLRLPWMSAGEDTIVIRNLRRGPRWVSRAGLLVEPEHSQRMAALARALPDTVTAVEPLSRTQPSAAGPVLVIFWTGDVQPEERQRILATFGMVNVARDSRGTLTTDYVKRPHDPSGTELPALQRWLNWLPEIQQTYFLSQVPYLSPASFDIGGHCQVPPDTLAWPENPITQFVRNSGLPLPSRPHVLARWPGYDATVFQVAYGPVYTVDLSCRRASVFGLEVGRRIGWLIGRPHDRTGQADSLLRSHRFRIRPEDDWLMPGRVDVLADAAEFGGRGWSFVEAVKHTFVHDEDTPRMALERAIHGLYRKYDWLLVELLLRAPKVRRDGLLLKDLVFVPHGFEDHNRTAGKLLLQLMPEVLVKEAPRTVLLALTHSSTDAHQRDTVAMDRLLEHPRVRRDIVALSMLAFYRPEAARLLLGRLGSSSEVKRALSEVLLWTHHPETTRMLNALANPLVREDPEALLALANFWSFASPEALAASRLLPESAFRRWEPRYRPVEE